MSSVPQRTLISMISMISIIYMAMLSTYIFFHIDIAHPETFVGSHRECLSNLPYGIVVVFFRCLQSIR